MNHKSKTLSAFIVLLASLIQLKADTLTYSDSINQIVYNSGGTLQYVNADNFTQISIKLGWFSDGFTPSATNFSSWETNFNPMVNDVVLNYTGKGALGYAISTAAATALGAPAISVQIGSGANNTGGSSFATMPVGKLLWLIGSSVPNATALSTGSLYNVNSATEFFAATGGLADSTWVIPSITSEGGTNDFSLSVIDSSADVIVGTYLSGNRIQMAVIPEPSTSTLLVCGLAGAFSCFRRKNLAKGVKSDKI